jgi:hypothetical protein
VLHPPSVKDQSQSHLFIKYSKNRKRAKSRGGTNHTDDGLITRSSLGGHSLFGFSDDGFR